MESLPFYVIFSTRGPSMSRSTILAVAAAVAVAAAASPAGAADFDFTGEISSTGFFTVGLLEVGDPISGTVSFDPTVAPTMPGGNTFVDPTGSITVDFGAAGVFTSAYPVQLKLVEFPMDNFTSAQFVGFVEDPNMGDSIRLSAFFSLAGTVTEPPTFIDESNTLESLSGFGVGSITDEFAFTGFDITAVPEPGILGLIAFGLLCTRRH